MTRFESARHGRRMLWPLILGVLGLAAIGAAAGLTARGGDAQAQTAGCPTHANTAEEMDFLSQLQAWRDANIAGSLPLIRSANLNAAAAGYAQFLANTPGAGGHYADGSNWANRALACGFSSTHPGDGYSYPAAAGGEGLAVVEASSQITVSASQALAIMAGDSGGGIWVPSSVGPPVICVGVAKAVNAAGTKVAWVAEIFGSTGGTCDGANPPTAVPSGTITATTTSSSTPTPSTTAPASATTSPSATSSSTATSTATPSPTPSPTPTPKTYRAWAPMIAKD